MVELVKDFEALKLHSAYCREILYRVEEFEEGFRIRVRAGRFGFDKTLKKEQVEEILKWLKGQDAIELVGSVSDDVFFA